MPAFTPPLPNLDAIARACAGCRPAVLERAFSGDLPLDFLALLAPLALVVLAGMLVFRTRRP